jgi:hypothetical protein
MPGYENLKDRDDQAIPQHQTEDGTASEATKGSDYADWSASIASAAAQGFKPVVYAALTNSPQPIKASKGKLGGWHVENPGGATLYLQFFRKPHDTVTLGTDAPYQVVEVPAAGTDPHPASMPGYDYWTAPASGISVAATGSPTGNDAPDSPAVATFYYV